MQRYSCRHATANCNCVWRAWSAEQGKGLFIFSFCLFALIKTSVFVCIQMSLRDLARVCGYGNNPARLSALNAAKSSAETMQELVDNLGETAKRKTRCDKLSGDPIWMQMDRGTRKVVGTIAQSLYISKTVGVRQIVKIFLMRVIT